MGRPAEAAAIMQRRKPGLHVEFASRHKAFSIAYLIGAMLRDSGGPSWISLSLTPTEAVSVVLMQPLAG